MSNTFFTRIAAAAFIGLATVGATGATVSFAGPAMAAPAPSVGPSTTGMYGDPTEAAEFWAEQSLDDCTLMAIASVVGQVTGGYAHRGGDHRAGGEHPVHYPPWLDLHPAGQSGGSQHRERDRPPRRGRRRASRGRRRRSSSRW